jgi:hypothetical protein
VAQCQRALRGAGTHTSNTYFNVCDIAHGRIFAEDNIQDQPKQLATIFCATDLSILHHILPAIVVYDKDL